MVQDDNNNQIIPKISGFTLVKERLNVLRYENLIRLNTTAKKDFDMHEEH